MRAHHWFAAIVLLGFLSASSGALGAGDDDDSASAPSDDDDSAAPSVATPPLPTPPAPAQASQETEICDDDKDNDGDGLVDCKDLNDCGAFPGCGQIRGGWGWVISAYGISFAALLAYALVVTLRLRTLQRRGEQ